MKCPRIQQRIECVPCGYPASEALYLLGDKPDPGCFKRLRDMQRRSDILALVLAGLILTLCELLVVQVVEVAQEYSMTEAMGAMSFHIPRHESGHYIQRDKP